MFSENWGGRYSPRGPPLGFGPRYGFTVLPPHCTALMLSIFMYTVNVEKTGSGKEVVRVIMSENVKSTGGGKEAEVVIEPILLENDDSTGGGKEVVIVTLLEDVESTGGAGGKEVVIVTLLKDDENTGGAVVIVTL